MNEIMKVIEQRTSLRRYKDVPIKDEDLEQLLYAAQRAPTAGNMMLYHNSAHPGSAYQGGAQQDM